MSNIVGWIGSLALALCGLPQAWMSFRQGHSNGVSKLFVFLWLLGELCLLYFTVVTLGFVPQLMVNYLVNILFTGVILYFMVGRK